MLFALGCGEEPGIDAVTEWAVDPNPVVSVGEVEGDSAYLFQQIVDVELGTSGELIVADAGLGAIRIFDPAGGFLVQTGRTGDGPGEFRWLRSLATAGEGEVVAWDSKAARLTWVDVSGTVLRSVPLERSEAANGVGTLDLLVGPLSDGSVLVGTVGLGSRDRVGPDLISIERFGPDGTHRGRVLETTGFHRDRLTERLTGPVAFSPRPMFALDGASLYHTTGERGVVFRTVSGARDSIVVPIQPAALGSAWDVLRARLTEAEVTLYDQALDHAPRPDSLPALSGLLVDTDGSIWVKAFDPATDALWIAASNGTGGVWSVVSPAGVPVSRVALPSGFAPHVLTDSSVVGVHTDALGIQRVRVHRLHRRVEVD